MSALDLATSIRDLVDDHGLEPVIQAVLAATREAGTPYGAMTPRSDDGTLEGHRPCFHCGASTPTGEVWDASEDGVVCTVRCGTCGRDYAEFYEVGRTAASPES